VIDKKKFGAVLDQRQTLIFVGNPDKRVLRHDLAEVWG